MKRAPGSCSVHLGPPAGSASVASIEAGCRAYWIKESYATEPDELEFNDLILLLSSGKLVLPQ